MKIKPPWLDDRMAANGCAVKDNFASWFSTSKVVHPNGDPMVLFHGTKSEFLAFRPTQSGEFGPAIYLTDNVREASEYGDGKGWGGPSGTVVLPVYLKITNPFTEGVDAFWKAFGAMDGDAQGIQRAKAAGFDGVMAHRADCYYDNDLRSFVDRGTMLTHWVAFDPNQIKSATGNSGLYLSSSPSILDGPGEPETVAIVSALRAIKALDAREIGQRKHPA